MKKKNMVLSIIAIAAFLVVVVGAIFAYFASATDEGNGSKESPYQLSL